MNGTMTLHSVESIKVTPAAQLGTDRICREIVIYLKDGSAITLELFTHNDELKLEIE